jgi:hypothetical protein
MIEQMTITEQTIPISYSELTELKEDARWIQIKIYRAPFVESMEFKPINCIQIPEYLDSNCQEFELIMTVDNEVESDEVHKYIDQVGFYFNGAEKNIYHISNIFKRKGQSGFWVLRGSIRYYDRI